MKNKISPRIKEIIQQIYPVGLIIFLVLQTLVVTNIIQENVLSFAVFGLFLGVAGIYFSNKSLKTIKISSWWLVTAILLTILFRVIPYLNNSVPHGYDAGLYRNAFENPFGDESLKTYYPLFFLSVMSTLTRWTSSNFVLIPLFIIISASTCGFIFLAAQKLFDKDVATIAALFFAFSLTQYHVFSNLFYKNALGIIFLLISFIFFVRSKTIQPGLIAVGSLLGGIHRPAFLLFGFTYLIFFVINLKKYQRKEMVMAALNGLAIIIIAISINFDRIDEFFLGRFAVAINTNGRYGDQGGFYQTFWEYLNQSALLIAFAIPGIFSKKYRKLPLGIALIILLIIIVGKLW